MNMRTKFEVGIALPVPEIIGGTQKWGSLWIRQRSLFTKIFNELLFGYSVNVPAKFEVHRFTRSWDNWWYPINLGSLWIHPHSLFTKIFMGFCSDGRTDRWTDNMQSQYCALHVSALHGKKLRNELSPTKSPLLLHSLVLCRLSSWDRLIWDLLIWQLFFPLHSINK